MGPIGKTSIATCLLFCIGIVALTLFGDPMGGEPRANLPFKPAQSSPSMSEEKPTRKTQLPSATTANASKTKQGSVLSLPPNVQRVDFGGKTPIALIITGLGLDETKTEKAMFQLPPAVTLSFSPYGDNLAYWSNRLNAVGRGFWLELPIETHNPSRFDHGPHSLRTKLSADENLSRLHWVLEQMDGEKGLIARGGERFLFDPQACLPVARKLNTKRIPLAYTSKQQCHLAQGKQKTRNQFHHPIDTIVDILKHPNQIGLALQDLERHAKANGMSVGLAGSSAISIRLIAKWAQSLSDRGFILVPLHQTMKLSPA